MTASSGPLIPPNLLSTSVFHRSANPALTNGHQGPTATDTSSTSVVGAVYAAAVPNLGGNTEQPTTSAPPAPVRPPLVAASSSPASLITATMIKREEVEQRILDTSMVVDPPSLPASSVPPSASISASASATRPASVSASVAPIRVASPPPPPPPSSLSARSERDTARARDSRRDYSPPPPSSSSSSSINWSSHNDSYQRHGDYHHHRNDRYHREDHRYHREDHRNHREDHRTSSSSSSSRNHAYGQANEGRSFYRPLPPPSQQQQPQQQQRDNFISERGYDSQSRDQRRAHHRPLPPSGSSTAAAAAAHSDSVDYGHRDRRDGRTAGRKRSMRDVSDQSMSESEPRMKPSSTTRAFVAQEEALTAAAAAAGGNAHKERGSKRRRRRREAKRARRDDGDGTTIMVSPAESPKHRSNRVASDSSKTTDGDNNNDDDDDDDDDSSTSESDSDLEDLATSITGVNGTVHSHGGAMSAQIQQQVRSVEAVRLQGAIHDLMMQLEKAHSKHRKYAQKAAQAVKKIQVFNGRLEKTFRQLNEMNLEQEQKIAEAMQQQQDQSLQLQRKVKELEATAAAATAAAAAATAASASTTTSHFSGPIAAASGTNVAADRRIGVVVEDDLDRESDIELESGQASAVHVVASPIEDQQLASTVAPTLMRRRSIVGGSSNSSSNLSSSSSSLAAQANINLARRATERKNSVTGSGRFVLSSKPVVDTLTNLKIDLRSKAFARKPRSLLMYNPHLSGENLKDVMVTSSLDGNIQFWDLHSRRMASQLHKNQLQFPWAEDVCWVGKDLLAVASAYAQGQPQQRQLSLVHVNAVPASGRQGRATVSSVCQPVNAMPHDKTGINVLASVDQFTDGSFVVATGGTDKMLYQWRFGAPDSDGDYVALDPQLIHSRHTSGIQGLCYSRFDNLMYSGGTDCRLVAWDMQHQWSVIDHRYHDRGRITHILPNPQDPRLFLISHADKANQLRLMDSRVGAQETVLSLGFPVQDNISRYVAPSWHPSGGLISCGTTSGTCKIHLWDIRWKNVERGPGQSINVHDKTILRAAFHPTHSMLASLSTDNTLAFIDFQLNPETVVHTS
ncbi:hypothetical protein DFQ26_008634 [Actinomortierella ambigua]|nr:hypothetical protein DFQ26_008634 [Actinomortierella ambigua]